MMSKTAAEPLVRISKREGTTFVQKVLVRAIAILLALVVDAFFIFFVTGLNPISVYGVMWNGTFMNTTRFSWALRDLSSLLCIAIALAPAFKMRFWNIGGEGQVLIGGLVAALIMVYFGSSLPAPLLFAAMVIGSVLAGAIWAFVPAWFKSRWNTNETLFTLMMNYVATSIVACMTNIMRGQASSLGTLNKATKAGWLPVINGQRYTINIIVVLVLTFAMYAYLKYSKQGYEISVVGESENTARYAGINVSRVMIRTMLLSGAICGLCGFLVVAGKDQTISTTSAGGNGFTATRLTDAEGKRGYGVGWDSSRPDIAEGTGFVHILKLEGEKPLDWNIGGKRLANTASGHPALSGEPARFEFTLRGGVLTLKIDGKVVASAKDDSFRSFSRLYLRGNQSQLIDNIVLTEL